MADVSPHRNFVVSLIARYVQPIDLAKLCVAYSWPDPAPTCKISCGNYRPGCARFVNGLNPLSICHAQACPIAPNCCACCGAIIVAGSAHEGYCIYATRRPCTSPEICYASTISEHKCYDDMALEDDHLDTMYSRLQPLAQQQSSWATRTFVRICKRYNLDLMATLNGFVIGCSRVLIEASCRWCYALGSQHGGCSKPTATTNIESHIVCTALPVIVALGAACARKIFRSKIRWSLWYMRFELRWSRILFVCSNLLMPIGIAALSSQWLQSIRRRQTSAAGVSPLEKITMWSVSTFLRPGVGANNPKRNLNVIILQTLFGCAMAYIAGRRRVT